VEEFVTLNQTITQFGYIFSFYDGLVTGQFQ